MTFINAQQDFSQASCQKTCPLGRAVSEGLRPLHFYNSLRSIKQTMVCRLSSFSPGKFCELRDFAYGQNLCVLYAKFPPPKAKRLQLVYAPQSPQGKNDRLRYRSAEWTVSTPWSERFQLCWHLRLRLGNVSKLPFLSACT